MIVCTILAVFLLTCVQGESTATVSSECAASLNKARQYVINPCGGPCPAMSRDVMIMQMKEISRRANLEIERYLKLFDAHGFLLPLQLTNPKLDLPTFKKNLSFEDEFIQAYKDLSVYFSYCVQIEDLERKLSLQTENIRYILTIESDVFRFMRVIMAGKGREQNSPPLSQNIYKCLPVEPIVYLRRLQARTVLQHLSIYFLQMNSYLMSV
ncbi:uncharacterized protein LOC134232171 [Saccostrea cucullata]|uniref:uncharacterized protein LOC134232171 n=1 Tax=Saccostrea cuccullata TaxID=36930 RepID=UPI002ED23A72